MENNIKPMFEGNKNAIACSSSQEYAPYLSVYLQSIKENASSKNQYDIIVFESSWTDELRKRFQNFFNSDNFSVRFVNPEPYFEGVNLYVTHSYFKRECYYRLSAPQILKNYNKILFTDIDLISKEDIAEIFKVDLKENVIAACIEPMYKELCETHRTIAGIYLPTYTEEVLKIKPENYYNTGVMLIDVNRYLKENVFDKICKLISENRFVYQEQCALNCFFKENITPLSSVWNYEADPTIYKKNEYYKEYLSLENNSKICHFLGREKPWINPTKQLAYIWWQYARQTPFYEEILSRMINYKINQSKANGSDRGGVQLLFAADHSILFLLKKWYCKFRKTFSFSKHRKEKYKTKYKKLKSIIKDARKFKKQMMKV